jgi:hypothetical protein
MNTYSTGLRCSDVENIFQQHTVKRPPEIVMEMASRLDVAGQDETVV